MSDQPEAMRLAQALIERHGVESFEGDAAAELRRLHASCEDYAQHKQRQDQRVLELAERVLELKAQRDALLEVLKGTTAHLVAAVSLLERGSKKAAASDRMFDQMLIDYTNSFERARAAIKAVEEEA